MATIAEIRQKYPQYGDLSDAQLADKLYSKFYSDMPREEFNQKIGLSVAAPQGEPQSGGGFLQSAGRVISEAASGFAQPFNEPGAVSAETRARLTNAPAPIAAINESLVGAVNTAGRIAQAPFEAVARGGAQLIQEVGGTPVGTSMGLTPEAEARKFREEVSGPVSTITQLAAGTTPVRTAPTMGQLSSAKTMRGAGRADTLSAFERQGVEPMAGAVSGSRGIQSMEASLSAAPGSAGIIQRAAETTVGQLGVAVDSLAGKVGSKQSPQVVGGLLKQAAGEALKRFEKKREALDLDVERTIGSDTVVGVENVENLLNSLKEELAKAPNSRPELLPAIQEMENIMADAKGGVIPFGQLRKIRTRVGRDTDFTVGKYKGGENTYMKQLYGALKDDVNAAANATPEGKAALAAHDNYVKSMNEKNLPVLNDLMRLGTDEQVYNWALAQGKIGGTRIDSLRRAIKDEYGEGVWDEVVSTVIARMGDARAGQQGVPTELLGRADTFSVDSFADRFSTMSEEAKKALFGGSRYADIQSDLEDLVKIAASLKDADKMTNKSNTGRALLFNALLASGATALTGNLKLGAGLLGTSVGVPYVAAKLLTNKSFIRWLTAGAKSMNNPKNLKNHILRLGAIANANPDIAEDITGYVQALTQTLPPEMLPEETFDPGDIMIPQPPVGGFSSQPMGVQ